MKNILGFLLCLISGIALAQSPGAPQPGQPYIWMGPSVGAQFHPPIAGVGGNAPNMSGIAGQLFTMGVAGQTVPVGTATGTTEQVLGTYTLPAGALDVQGRRIRVHATYLAANNADVKTIKCYFGASVISVPVTVSAATVATCNLDVLKNGSNTQQVTGTAFNGTYTVPTFTAGADTDTSAITIKTSATDGTSAANDLTLEDFYVEYLN